MLATIQEAIEDFRDGRMVIIVDDEDRDAVAMAFRTEDVLLVRRNARRRGNIFRAHYDVIPTTFFRSSRSRTELVCSSRT